MQTRVCMCTCLFSVSKQRIFSLYSVATSVHSVEMTGIPLNGRQTTLVTSLMGGANKPQPQLVNLQLEISPIDRPDLDVTVKAALSPIKITYDFVCWEGGGRGGGKEQE